MNVLLNDQESAELTALNLEWLKRNKKIDSENTINVVSIGIFPLIPLLSVEIRSSHTDSLDYNRDRMLAMDIRNLVLPTQNKAFHRLVSLLGWVVLGELTRRQETELLKFRRVGRKFVVSVRNALEEMGLYLGMNQAIGPIEKEARLRLFPIEKVWREGFLLSILKCGGYFFVRDVIDPNKKDHLVSLLDSLVSQPKDEYFNQWLSEFPTSENRYGDIVSRAESVLLL